MMRSFWLEDVLAREGGERSAPPLSGEERADVCIVGGGFTGLWTALRLKELEPQCRVAVVEADICGGGASGRNSGFVMSWVHKAPALFKLCGPQEGMRLVHASEAAVVGIGEFCARHGIDASYRREGWIWTATNPTQAGSLEGIVDTLERLGLHPFDKLSRDETARRTGSGRNLAGLFEEGVATIHPAALARGLRRVALAKGVRIYESSPMRAIDGGRPYRVVTPQGSVVAPWVVLGLETWAAELPEFRRAFMVVSADGVMTEPVPDVLAGMGLERCVAISDSRQFVNAIRRTVDGRLHLAKAIGAVPFAGRLGRRFDGPSPERARLAAELRRFYPSLGEARVVSAWRGSVTRTKSGLPFFGALPKRPGVLFAHGYSGSGVGPSFLAGRVLASLALERRDEWSETPFSHGPLSAYPPEPVRFVGAWLVRRAVARKEGAEDAGRRAGALASLLSRLAPASLDARADT